MNASPPKRRSLLPARLTSVSWRDLLVVGLPGLLIALVAVWTAVKFVRPAPPNVIYFVGGPPDSNTRTMAEKYRTILARHGVRVDIVASRGGLDSLKQLADPRSRGDVGFVQGGMGDGVDMSHLMSLGSVFVQPLMIYYRSPQNVDRLTQFKGKRLAIGPEGSGTRALALALLEANEMKGAPTVLLDLSGNEAAQALIAGRIDAAFLTGDTATREVNRSLREVGDVKLMNFRQAAGYARRLRFLSRLTLPEGGLDLADNIPPAAYELIGPTVELVAQKDLHPALSDLLIGAAREVHSPAGLFREAGAFPAAIAHELPLSEDAERYYQSGGQFLYKRLPFWLASLLDRLLVVVLPLLVILVPITKGLPAIYSWRVRSRIYRWYGALMQIEREMMAGPTTEQHASIDERLDEIEDAVNGLKTPLSFADQLYVLREHVGLVRHRLASGPTRARRAAEHA